MASAQDVIRRVQRLCGDRGGQMISKEDIVDLINEEAPRVLARFPSKIEVTGNQTASEAQFKVELDDYNAARHKVLKVYLDQCEARIMDQTEMEAIVHEL